MIYGEWSKMSKDIIIRGKNICKKYSKELILKNIEINIIEGDFTVIMGSSGSGKSTLLNSLSGMDSITDGEIKFKGNDITKMSDRELSNFRKEYIGFIFQEINLLEHLSVIENITLPAYLLNKEKLKKIKESSENLLKAIGMKGYENRFPKELSGGQRQRVAIARALINSPDVIFADEPTGALNSNTSNQILDLLTDINRREQSIVMVTHDLKAALRANRIIYLCDGEIAGELQLTPYQEIDVKNREIEVLEWLNSMGW